MTERVTEPEPGADKGAGDERPRLFVPQKVSVLRRLRTHFLTGVVVTAPIGITLYLAWLFITYVDGKVTPLIPAQYNPETYLPFGIPGLGLVISIVVLTLIGAIAKNFLGRAVVGIGERLLARMPVIRNVYGALKQIFETVLAQSSMAFREVVMVEYPRRGLWALAFVTTKTKGEVQNVTEDEVVNIFLPTTPNPTSGFLLFVPRKDLVTMHMTVEDGIKMVISGGLVTPPGPEAKPEAIADATPETKVETLTPSRKRETAS